MSLLDDRGVTEKLWAIAEMADEVEHKLDRVMSEVRHFIEVNKLFEHYNRINNPKFGGDAWMELGESRRESYKRLKHLAGVE
jgi:hypothetical protein